jgi:hypothetical protein
VTTLDQALAKGHGTWRSFTCPDHDDKNPSARVNTLTGKWVCMVCHSKGTTQGYVPDVDMLLESAMETLDSLDLEKPESWLDQFDSGPVAQYWLSRFSEEVCRTYRLGWDGVKGKPCYPIRAMNGRPLGVVHRSLDPAEKKYKYPLHVNTSELLFGVHELRQTDELVLLEGAPAAIAVREVGHDAISSYGSLLHPRQIEEIVNLQPKIVYIAFDMDKAGHLGAGPAERDLAKAGVLAKRIFWDDRYSDPGDMDLATRSNTLSQALARTSTKR